MPVTVAFDRQNLHSVGYSGRPPAWYEMPAGTQFTRPTKTIANPASGSRSRPAWVIPSAITLAGFLLLGGTSWLAFTMLVKPLNQVADETTPVPAILKFGDVMPLNACLLSSYQIVGSNGVVVELTGIGEIGDRIAIDLNPETISEGNYRIQFSPLLTDLAGNQVPEGEGGFEIGVTITAMLLSGPMNGDWLVHEFSQRIQRVTSGGAGTLLARLRGIWRMGDSVGVRRDRCSPC